MKKYLGVIRMILKINISYYTSYRANFIANIISSVGWGIMSVLVTMLLTSKSSSVFGWSRTDFLILIAILNVILGVYRVIFDPNLWRLTQKIHNGELDVVLTRPIDSQFQLSVFVLDLGGILRLLIAIVFTIYLFTFNHIPVSPLQFILFVLLGICGATVMYSVMYIGLTTTMWNSTLSNLVDLLNQISTLGRYPKEMFQQLANVWFYILFPLVIIISTPTKVLLNKDYVGDGFFLVFFAIVFLFVSRIFWKFALRSYTSASG